MIKIQSKLKFNKIDIILLFSLFIVITPGYIEYLIPSNIIFFIRLILNIFLVIELLRYGCTISVATFFFAIYNLIITFSTFVNFGIDIGKLGYCILYSLLPVTIVIFIENLSTKNFVRLINILHYFCIYYIIINFICILVYPNGFVESRFYTDQEFYFLGAKLEVALYSILLLSVNIVYDKLIHGKITKISVILLIITIVVNNMMHCATGLIITITYVLILIFKDIIYKLNILNARNIVVVIAVIVTFVLTGYYKNISFISDFFQNVLNKSIDLTGRTYIYNHITTIINNSPILGYGFNNNIVFRVLGHAHAHNSYLQIIIDSGGMGFVIWLIYFVITLNKIVKNKMSKYSIIILGAIVSIMVGAIADNVFQISFYLILTIGANMNKLKWKV